MIKSNKKFHSIYLEYVHVGVGVGSKVNSFVWTKGGNWSFSHTVPSAILLVLLPFTFKAELRSLSFVCHIFQVPIELNYGHDLYLSVLQGSSHIPISSQVYFQTSPHSLYTTNLCVCAACFHFCCNQCCTFLFSASLIHCSLFWIGF